MLVIQPAMDVLPPPDYPPVQPRDYPQIPTRIPLATLEISRSYCVSGGLQGFRVILELRNSSLENFDICDFHVLMIEAIN